MSCRENPGRMMNNPKLVFETEKADNCTVSKMPTRKSVTPIESRYSDMSENVVVTYYKCSEQDQFDVANKINEAKAKDPSYFGKTVFPEMHCSQVGPL